MDFSWVLPTIVGVVIGLISWLLAKKDEQQAKEMKADKEYLEAAILALKTQHEKDIEILHRMHKEDATKLDELQRELDREHYRKTELDNKFDKLDNSIQEGFKGVRSDMKEMMKLVHDHIAEENGRAKGGGQ